MQRSPRRYIRSEPPAGLDPRDLTHYRPRRLLRLVEAIGGEAGLELVIQLGARGRDQRRDGTADNESRVDTVDHGLVHDLAVREELTDDPDREFDLGRGRCFAEIDDPVREVDDRFAVSPTRFG